jgi:hypothetical protein
LHQNAELADLPIVLLSREDQLQDLVGLLDLEVGGVDEFGLLAGARLSSLGFLGLGALSACERLT